MGVGFILKPNIILYRDITVESGGNGTVSGGGRSLGGDMATVSAAPAADYKFDGWYGPDGNLISTANPYRFKVRRDVHLQARFSLVLRNVSQQFYEFGADYGYGNPQWHYLSYFHGVRPKSASVRLGMTTGAGFYGYTTHTFTTNQTISYYLPALANGASGSRTMSIQGVFESGRFAFKADTLLYGNEMYAELQY